jgi:hypothetical protein
MPLFFPSPTRSNSLLKQFWRLRRSVPVDNNFPYPDFRFFGSIGLPFRLASNNPGSSLLLITSDFYTVGQVAHLLSTYRLMTLSAFSLPSFAGGIAGVASGLPLGFEGGFPRCLIGEFRIAGLLLGFQRGLASGNLDGLRGG